MEPFEAVLLDALLTDLRALPEDELRLMVAALAVADPRLVAHAMLWVGRVADSVSEPPVG